MIRANYLALLVGMGVFLPSIHDAVAQSLPACATVETMGTDVWASTLGGTTDPQTFSLNQAPDGHISGTFRTNGGGFCIGVSYPVSGAYQGNGDFMLTATNISVPTGCAKQFTFHGTVSGLGCDKADVSWITELGATGGGTVIHRCYAPSTETPPVPDGWGAEPNNATIATFRQSLVPTTYNWGGRTIYETSPIDGTDTCYNEAIDAPFNIPKGDRVTGASKVFTSGSSYGDDIGATEALVTYYRAHHRVPCGYQVRQALWIECDPGSSGQSADVNYLTYTDSYGFGSTDVIAVRDGVPSEKFWLSPETKAAATQMITRVLLKRKH